jgi:hypothetical protein
VPRLRKLIGNAKLEILHGQAAKRPSVWPR